MKIRLTENEPKGRAERGQVLILFAIFLVGMVGMMALSVDLGVSFTERRAMQNAADAGALAGARTITKSTTSSPLSVFSDVKTAADNNKMKIGAIDQYDCNYVDDTDTSL